MMLYIVIYLYITIIVRTVDGSDGRSSHESGDVLNPSSVINNVLLHSNNYINTAKHRRLKQSRRTARSSYKKSFFKKQGFPGDPETYRRTRSGDPEAYRRSRAGDPDHSPSISPSLDLRKENRKSNPDIEDIITGIIKILGGNVNVKVAENEESSSGLLFPTTISTRINNRGPPKFTKVPYPGAKPPHLGYVPTFETIPIPLRPPPPVRPGDLPSRIKPGRLPPYALPKPGRFPPFQRPSIAPPPFVTGVPIPERIVPSLSSSFQPPDVDDENATKPSKKQENKTITLDNLSDQLSSKIQSITEVDLKFGKPHSPLEWVPDKARVPPSTKSKETSTDSPTVTKPSDATTTNTTTTTINTTPSHSPATTITPTKSSQVIKSTKESTKTSEIIKSTTQIIHTIKSTVIVSTSRPTTTKVPLPLPTATRTPEVIKVQPSYRPGVVLDESYRPRDKLVTGGAYNVFPSTRGDVFDVTVTAHQGFQAPEGTGRPYVVPYDLENVNADTIITSPHNNKKGSNNYVSIDGRKTYINLQPATRPSAGFRPYSTSQATRPTTRRPFTKRPVAPAVRIDTCIVGDDSTCDEEENEVCRTVYGVSSCYCRPGFARKRPRRPCQRVVSVVMSLKVDRVYERRIRWNSNYRNPDSEDYQLLEWEAENAIDSALDATRFSELYMGSTVNKFYPVGGKVIVNATINLVNTPLTNSDKLKKELKHQVIEVIETNNNRVGDSQLYVDTPRSSVADLTDLNECGHDLYHDCHENAICYNVFGGFQCKCSSGYTDEYSGDIYKSGRQCDSCSPSYCNNHGDCKVEDGEQSCECRGSYMGSRCEIDGEVLGVALGASLAALVIIILTLVCLCMWSRRWKREQQKADGMSAAHQFLYMSTKNGIPGSTSNISTVYNTYRNHLDDRIRWSGTQDTLHQNVYAPVYHTPGLPSLPTIAESSRARTPVTMIDSSEDDLDDHELLVRGFHVPRPKSRASYSNHSSMHHDMDSMLKKQPPIPMSTYSHNFNPF